ncbi:MAG TPA: 2-hydroxyacid dehydrogenase [Candidatus Dormibacteraeota bacterium]|nr:2-hydroxyacid dehydrogenase [Candidatus Dormibacteraeota bacterium]
MAVRIASLSPYSEEVVRGLFPDVDALEIALVPPPPAPEAVRAAVADADLVLADKKHKHRLDRTILAGMTRCQLIQQPAVGFDAIDHRAAAELGIPVANAAGYNRDAVADWTVMAMLNLLRDGGRGDRAMRAGEWPYGSMRGRELGALTVGIVGLGNVGNAVATRLRAFGARVVFTDVVPRSLPGADALPLADLLAEADVVTLHVPLDHDTRHLIGDAELARMKPGAILLNASRGPVVDETALVRALDAGRLGGAGLDVFEVEPLAADSPLRAFDNVFLSPHAAALTDEAERRLLEVCGANLRRVLAGLEPFNVVNGVSHSRRAQPLAFPPERERQGGGKS